MIANRSTITLAVVPKASSVFTVGSVMAAEEIDLFGDQMRTRPAERSSRKAKAVAEGNVDL